MSSVLPRSSGHPRRRRVVVAFLAVAGVTELSLIRLGRTYGVDRTRASHSAAR